MRQVLIAGLALLLQQGVLLTTSPQGTADLPPALSELIATERAFQRRADETSTQRAFLEFFADDAVGFNEGFEAGREGNAKEQFRLWPHPPRNVEFHWEPRYGDVSASGDLGYLTGPVWTRVPGRNEGRPRHGNYTSVWKRQKDGSFKVVMDVGMQAPDRVVYAPGFTRAPHAERYTGGEGGEKGTLTLMETDRAFTAAVKASPAEAYKRYFAARGRLHRSGFMPAETREAAVAWHDLRPAWDAGESKYAEAAEAGDLGYTWGTYSCPAGPDTPAESGFYLRTWTRNAAGQWLVAVDVTTAKTQR